MKYTELRDKLDVAVVSTPVYPAGSESPVFL